MYVWFAHNFLFTISAINLTRKLMNANFILLAFVCLIPFSAALIGEYPESKIAVLIYSLNVALIGIITYIIRDYVYSSPDIENPHPDTISYTNRDKFYGTVRIAIAVFGSVLAVILSFLDSRISLAILVLQSIILVTPGAVALVSRLLLLDRLHRDSK